MLWRIRRESSKEMLLSLKQRELIIDPESAIDDGVKPCWPSLLPRKPPGSPERRLNTSEGTICSDNAARATYCRLLSETSSRPVIRPSLSIVTSPPASFSRATFVESSTLGAGVGAIPGLRSLSRFICSCLLASRGPDLLERAISPISTATATSTIAAGHILGVSVSAATTTEHLVYRHWVRNRWNHRRRSFRQQ